MVAQLFVNVSSKLRYFYPRFKIILYRIQPIRCNDSSTHPDFKLYQISIQRTVC